MSDAPVNLNWLRKERDRAEAKSLADANAVRHGRTKAERLLEATRNAQARAMLDRHKREEDE